MNEMKRSRHNEHQLDHLMMMNCLLRRKRSPTTMVLTATVLLVILSETLGEAITTIGTSDEDSYQHDRAAEVCVTQSCKEAAEHFMSNMNTSVDPCHDFYEFACGRYGENHLPLSPNSIVYERGEGLLDNITADQEKLLPIKWMKTFYNQCKDRDSQNERGIDALHKITKRFGNWSDDNSRTVEDNLVEVFTQYGLDAIINIQVTFDPFDNNKQVLHVSPAVGLCNRFTEEDVASHRNEASKKLIRETAELLTRETIINDVDRIIEFERNLSMITNSSTRHPYDYDYDYHQVNGINNSTIKELNEMVKEIDFHRLILKMFDNLGVKKDIQPDTPVIVHDLGYLQKLGNVLKETPQEVINNYLGWKVIYSGGRWTTDKFRHNLREFREGGPFRMNEEEKSLEYSCKATSINKFPMAILRLYVDNYFSDDDKKAAEAMVRTILSIFNQTLTNHAWLDEETKRAAIAKVTAIIQIIGYPDWIKDDNQLNNEYPVESIKETAMENWFAVKRAFVKAAAERLDTPTDWSKVASNNVIGYNQKHNSLFLPATKLQGLMFSSSRPGYLNFGTVGYLAGKEISEAFYNFGSMFPPDWWTEQSREHFEFKEKCFDDQYRNEIQSFFRDSLGMFIANNEGLNTAFAAWKRTSNDRLQLIEQIEDWTPDQLFFLSYANELCTTFDWHSSKRSIINIPLMNSRQFAEAFQCQEGTNMNPKNKCSIS